MKETVKTIDLSESGKKVYDALKAKGLEPTPSSSIAFMFEEHEKTGYILFDFNATGIHFDRSELDMADLQKDNIHVWAEWYYKF